LLSATAIELRNLFGLTNCRPIPYKCQVIL
jgi:hypothetical protein